MDNKSESEFESLYMCICVYVSVFINPCINCENLLTGCATNRLTDTYSIYQGKAINVFVCAYMYICVYVSVLIYTCINYDNL